jgi:hypothetical protein
MATSTREGSVRRFKDHTGGVWDAVVGRESWGAVVALFVPRNGDAAARQASIPASGFEEATAWMESCSDDELRDRLDESTEKTR